MSQRQRLSIRVGGGGAHTHPAEGRGSDPGVLGQLIYSLASVPHFNKLSLCKLYKEITACAFIPAPSKPLAHLSQPLHIPSHLLLLSMSLYSALGATLTWHLSPELSDTRRPVERSGGLVGVQLARRSAKEIWPQSNGRSHPLCALTHSDNDSKQLRAAITNQRIKSEILLLVKLSPITGIFVLKLLLKDCMSACLEVKKVVCCLKFILDTRVNSVSTWHTYCTKALFYSVVLLKQWTLSLGIFTTLNMWQWKAFPQARTNALKKILKAV